MDVKTKKKKNSNFADANYTQLTQLYTKYKEIGMHMLFIYLSELMSNIKKILSRILIHVIWFENICLCLLMLGLEILGFPCNQFLRKEPGTSQEAQDFACDRYKAEYPILGKVWYNMWCFLHKFLVFGANNLKKKNHII